MAVTEAKRYEHVYTNVHLTDVPENVVYIENEWIGKYQLENCLILIDEATLFADNRDYKYKAIFQLILTNPLILYVNNIFRYIS